MLGKILGPELDASKVVALLEFILAAYDCAFIFNTKNIGIKILHIVLAIVWVALGLLNFMGK